MSYFLSKWFRFEDIYNTEAIALYASGFVRLIKQLRENSQNIQCIPKKGYLLKSSASAACSNLSTVTPVCTQQCVKRHCREFLCLHYNQIEIFSSKITQIGMHEYRQRRANTCTKILCYDF